MANLKDIDYGVGKYLTTSDASGLPNISSNTIDIERLHFKLATTNSFAKYDMKDGFLDAFQDTSGVDASASTNETRDGSGEYYSGSLAVSAATTAINSSGTWTAPDPAPTTVEVLVVAGGGGGGFKGGAGGGAGGIVHHASYAVTAGVVYDVTVGAGGSGAPASSAPDVSGTNGSNSVFNVNNEGSNTAMTAVGGGGGGSVVDAGGSSTSGYYWGNVGGSGGGSVYGGSGTNPRPGGLAGQPAVSGASVYGNNGGAGYFVGSPTQNRKNGGGGGAGGAGSGGSSGNGNGGAGRQFSNFSPYGVSSGYFGGGGGTGFVTGDGYSWAGPGTGQHGGGNGANTANGGAATANTGSGGGGGGYNISPNPNVNYAGGAGGSGFIGVHYGAFTAYQDITLVSATQTAVAAPTTGRLIIFEEAATGTTTINTDIKGWVSRDNGSNYDQITLSSKGTYETGKRILEGSVDFTMSASTNMRYKITTHNQASNKITRIHGASMLWS
jgi:hypothetical protein